jgi:hypothetical protein
MPSISPADLKLHIESDVVDFVDEGFRRDQQACSCREITGLERRLFRHQKKSASAMTRPGPSRHKTRQAADFGS